jgi:WD40 repeat protein
MATVGADGDAWLWDLDGTFHSQRLGGEADRALALAFSSDGRWLITGHEDATAKVWAVDDPTDVTVLEGHVGAVIDVAFSGTGAEAVCTSNDHNVRVWTLSHEALLDALWAATPHCPLPSWRGAELGEEPAEANQGHERCQKAVDERAPLAVQR